MSEHTEIAKKGKKGVSPLMVVLFILLIIYTLFMLLPLFWGLGQSLMDGNRLDSTVIPWPSDWKFSNYIDAFEHFYVPVQAESGTVYPTLVYMFGYSLVYAVGSALVATFVQCLVAYLTSRFNYVLSRIINVFVLVAIALPIVGSLPSEIQMAQSLGLYDTLFGIWIMKGHFISIYYLVFFARFKTFSKSYEEAAQIDGAGHTRTFFQIVLPLIVPSIATLAVLKFVWTWNDYQTPLIFLSRRALFTIQLGMKIFASESGSIYSLMMAAAVSATVPLIIVFLCGQRYIIEGIATGAVKG